MTEQKEVAAKKRRKRMHIDRIVKCNYQRARQRLGLSPNATGSVHWSEISTRSTFAWKCDTLLETAQWVIRESFAAIRAWPLVSRSQIIIHYTELGFGVAPSDILGSNRAPPIFTPRFVAMVTLYRTGISKAETARRFNRDHTTLKTALIRTEAFFEGISFDDHQLQNTVPFRLAPDEQPVGEIPA